MDEIHMIWVKSFLISFRHVQDGRTLISNTSTQFLNETFSYPCYGTKEKSAVDFTMCVYSLEKPALPLTLASDVARYMNSRLHLSWYDTTSERLAIFVRLALCFGTIHFIIWAASGFFEISLPIGKGTVNIFSPSLNSCIFHAYIGANLDFSETCMAQVRLWVMQLFAQSFLSLIDPFLLFYVSGRVLSFFMELV